MNSLNEKRLIDALDKMANFFRSGNEVPVERATIKASHPYVKNMFDVLDQDKQNSETTRVKAIYRKNLKMSEQKVAAQISHAVIGLGVIDPLCTIIVLAVSDKKFEEYIRTKDCYVHHDYGYTEVIPGEKTSAAWIENNQ